MLKESPPSYESAILRNEILVFEQEAWWTPELQRQFADSDIAVRMATSASRLLELLTAAGSAVIVIDFDCSPAEALQLLNSLRSLMLPRTILVLGTARTAELECPIRELGAHAFLAHHVTGEELARMCRRPCTSAQPKQFSL